MGRTLREREGLGMLKTIPAHLYSQVCPLSLHLPCRSLALTLIRRHPTGHIGPHSATPSVSVKSCHLLCFLPTESHLLSRSSLSVLLQFALGRPGPLLYPATCQYSACCAMYAGGPYGKHVQAIEVVFLSVCCPWFVVQFWF